MGGSGSGSTGAPRVLEDVVALVMCQDPVANAKAAVTTRIEGHGGRVVARLGKDVSHIVWERTRSRRPSDKAADEAQLLELFHKLEKVGRDGAAREEHATLLASGAPLSDTRFCPPFLQLEYPPVVVSPLWVEESIKAGRRLVERKYLVGWWRGVGTADGRAGRQAGGSRWVSSSALPQRLQGACRPSPTSAIRTTATQLCICSATQLNLTGQEAHRVAAGTYARLGWGGRSCRQEAEAPCSRAAKARRGV